MIIILPFQNPFNSSTYRLKRNQGMGMYESPEETWGFKKKKP